MARSLTAENCRFISRYADDFLFEVDFELKSKLTDKILINVFILMNKYYPSFVYYEGSISVSDLIKWEDLILKDYKLLREKPEYFDLYFDIPVVVNFENEERTVHTNHGGIKLTHEYGENETKRLFVGFYANVFADINYSSSFDENKRQWVENSLDQKSSATKNRIILSSFLQELEVVLNCEINGFESAKIDHIYLHKYGFKDNVVLTHI